MISVKIRYCFNEENTKFAICTKNNLSLSYTCLYIFWSTKCNVKKNIILIGQIIMITIKYDVLPWRKPIHIKCTLGTVVRPHLDTEFMTQRTRSFSYHLYRRITR